MTARRRAKPIKTVTFDLDGTLWDTEPALAAAEHAVHDWLGTNYPALAAAFSITDLRALRRELAAQNAQMRHNVTELRKAAVRIAAEGVGLHPGVADEAFAVFMAHRNRVQIYDEVPAVLERLRLRYMLCSLTNGNADIAHIGLGHLFAHSLSAIDVGAAKPASEIFLRVCAIAGVAPAEIVHVGDEPETDIAGARASGCRTVWVNRNALRWSYRWRPDAEIGSLAELEAVLASWN